MSWSVTLAALPSTTIVSGLWATSDGSRRWFPARALSVGALQQGHRLNGSCRLFNSGCGSPLGTSAARLPRCSGQVGLEEPRSACTLALASSASPREPCLLVKDQP